MNIVGISACPAGIAHTYMCREVLIQAAEQRGHSCKIETQGTIGVEFELTPEDIKNADVVVLAADVRVSGEERFEGKPIVRIGTAKVISNPLGFIAKLEKAMEGKLKK